MNGTELTFRNLTQLMTCSLVTHVNIVTRLDAFDPVTCCPHWLVMHVNIVSWLDAWCWVRSCTPVVKHAFTSLVHELQFSSCAGNRPSVSVTCFAVVRVLIYLKKYCHWSSVSMATADAWHTVLLLLNATCTSSPDACFFETVFLWNCCTFCLITT